VSFVLNGRGTVPKNLPIKAAGPFVLIGDYRVSLMDFLLMVEYVLGNTDLEPEDPRLIFLERLRKIRQGPGWKRGQRRLIIRGPVYRKWKARSETELLAEMSAAFFGHPTAARKQKRKAKRKTAKRRRPKRDTLVN